MKKIYFLIAFFVGFTVNAQIINFPDANFKSFLLDKTKPIYDVDGNSIIVDLNGNNEIEVTEAVKVYSMYVFCYTCTEGKIKNLDGIEYFTHLKVLEISYHDLKTINLSSLSNLERISLTGNYLENIDLTGLTNLNNIDLSYNKLLSINLNELTNLKGLYLSGNQLENIELNQLIEIDEINLSDNNLTNININGLPKLWNLTLDNNKINYLSINDCPKLGYLHCSDNLLVDIDFVNVPNLDSFYLRNNLFTHIDISKFKKLNYIDILNNSLIESAILKNGVCSLNIFPFKGTPNLKYICVDECLIDNVQKNIETNLDHACEVNNYCSFTPGGVSYTLEGNTKMDIDKNGCDADDLSFPYMKFLISDGSQDGKIISDASGNYSISIQEGLHTITPLLVNPNYYTISPSNLQVNFPTESNPFNQNFCITPNGSYNDLEIAIIPISAARPGFDATYKIIYKNVGTTVISGTVNYYFNDNVCDFISSEPSISNQTAGILTWDYTSLKALETREIALTLNVNTPMESPAVNIGDVLSYSTTIFPLKDDETPSNNGIGHRQTVVGSYDPNDKTCLEGNVVSDNMIGEYVNYLIRFENAGTYPAENVVVKDMIDTDKFDISTLIPVRSSHSFISRINENKVEFIFEKINLPFDDANNDGYIAFKIKTKPTLVLGDTFENTAEIFFDYNFPIVTNTASTTISNLGTQDFEFSNHFKLFPNPADNFLTVNSGNNIKINSLSIYNTLGQLIQVVANPLDKIDISNLKTGNYFIKLNTEKGSATTKFIKK